jgi:hypothetical protein
LDLTKEYKDEIKFAANLQEDLRKERSKFFSEGLSAVHKALDEVNMDKKVVDVWVTELVTSYTDSLNISSELAKEHVLDMIGILQNDFRKNITKVRDINCENIINENDE